MLFQFSGNGLIHQDCLLQLCQFLFQSGGQDCQAHDLDQANVFLLDMVQFSVGMEHTQRMLFGGDVITQDQIHLVILSPAACNGSDGIVGFAFGFCKDECVCIRVAAPGLQDAVSQICNPLLVRTGQPDDTHGPLYDTGLDILKALELHLSLHRRLLHGEGVAAALEMLMAQDTAAHNGQVRIASDEVMGEDRNKVQQLLKCCLIDLHGCMLCIERDAMLIVVDVGTVLQVPGLSADGDGNNAMVLPCGMVHPACVAFILHTQLALGVSRLGRSLRCGDGLGVLLRLTQIDGNIQVTILGGCLPPHILLDPVAADVIRILRELIEPVGGSLGVLLIQGSKPASHLPGCRSQDTHQFGIVQVTTGGIIGNDASIHCVIHKALQDYFQSHGASFRRFKAIQLLGSKQLVYNKRLVAGLDQFLVETILNQSGNVRIHIHNKTLL